MRGTTVQKQLEMKDKRRRFVEEYLVCRDATNAAVAAGYARTTASSRGYQFLRYPEVAAAIAEHDRALTAKLEITAERVLLETSRLAFSDHRKLYKADGSLKPLHELDDDTAAALASVESVTRVGRGAEGGSQLHKVKLGDKQAALVLLGRHLQLFGEKPKTDDTSGLAERIAAARKRAG
jgi:phage terminase small subunit